MANRIQLRRDTTANWENTDPVLADGEPGLDIVTNEIRIGDGSTSWTGLTANVIGGGGGSGSSLTNGSSTMTLESTGILTMPAAPQGKIIDATAARPLTLAQNEYADFTNFSGEILVNDTTDGYVYKLLVGSGKVCMLGTTNPAWDGTNTTPSTSYTLTGQFTISYPSSGVYRFTNLRAGSSTFNFAAIMTRAGS
jgi:hypothetical protein